METELFVCCVEMLKLLIDQYDSGKMDADTFRMHAQLKVEFIRDHHGDDYAVKNNEAVKQLLHNYNRILDENLEN